jgi:hypothetical protein
MVAAAEPTWNIAAIASVVSTVVAGFSLIVALRALRHNTRAMELQALQSIFHDVRELDRQYLAEFMTWDDSQKNAWSATFFNTAEYLCFVVNRKVTKDKELRGFFFQDALPAWRKMLDEHAKAGYIKNTDEMFPELKKAYRQITGQ